MTDLFSPSSKTVNITVSSSSQPVQVSNQVGKQQVRVANAGTAVVWIAFGDSTVAATSSTGLPILPSSTAGFTLVTPPGGSLWVAAIAAAATGIISFTPGAGI